MRTILALFFLPVLAAAQVYYSAYGQTVPFTLTAGAKAAWHEGIAVETSPSALLNLPSMSIYPIPSSGCPRIVVSGAKGSVIVSIYNVAGKKIRALDFSGGKGAALVKTMPNGIYFARMAVNGQIKQTTRFLVVR